MSSSRIILLIISASDSEAFSTTLPVNPSQTMTSASPDLIIRQPQASASAPDAHADTGACTPALAPSSSPT